MSVLFVSFFIYAPTFDMIPSNIKNIPINLFTKSQRDYNTCRRHKRRICHAYYFTGCFDGYIIPYFVLSFSNGLGTSYTSRICYEFLICLNIWKIGNCKSAQSWHRMNILILIKSWKPFLDERDETCCVLYASNTKVCIPISMRKCASATS